MDKMPECYFYTTFGECQNQECYFRHINPEEKMSDCPWYARGFCKNGPRCRHKHVRHQPCTMYLAGFCPKGSRCEYGHPKFETVSEIPDQPQPDFGAGSIKQKVSCHICRGQHKAHQCPQRGELERSGSIICFKCGSKDHKANACPNRRNWHQQGGGGGGGDRFQRPRY
ncbi:hypothetical protein GEMRC1_013020 [Eukaryota sp. GEM-RC1]